LVADSNSKSIFAHSWIQLVVKPMRARHLAAARTPVDAAAMATRAPMQPTGG
jgi:hypothetical protein